MATTNAGSQSHNNNDEMGKMSINFSVDLVKQEVTLAAFLVGFALAFTRLETLPSSIWLLKLGVTSLTVSFTTGLLCLSTVAQAAQRLSVNQLLSHKGFVTWGIVQGISIITGIILLTLFIWQYSIPVS